MTQTPKVKQEPGAETVEDDDEVQITSVKGQPQIACYVRELKDGVSNRGVTLTHSDIRRRLVEIDKYYEALA